MSKEKVMSLVRMRGPILPIEVAKSLGITSILAGAYLSELSSNKRIFISSLKIGGSPLYYTFEQRAKLQNYIHVLKAPEKKAFELLKEKKVLKDSSLDPLTRVSLKNIKDFAKPIEITLNGEKAIYWKWYLLSNEELKNIFSEQSASTKDETSSEEEVHAEKMDELPLKETEKESPARLRTDEKQQEATKEETKKEILNEEISQVGERKESKVSKEKNIVGETQSKGFEADIDSYLEKNDIKIISRTVIKQGSEIEYILLVPSAIGRINYYAIAKSKKRINDADIFQVFSQANVHKLPALLIYSGEISKKTREKLDKDFRMVSLLKI